jgi:hypothetical protein
MKNKFIASISLLSALSLQAEKPSDLKRDYMESSYNSFGLEDSYVCKKTYQNWLGGVKEEVIVYLDLKKMHITIVSERSDGYQKEYSYEISQIIVGNNEELNLLGMTTDSETGEKVEKIIYQFSPDSKILESKYYANGLGANTPLWSKAEIQCK